MNSKGREACWAAIAIELLKSRYLGEPKTYREIAKKVARYCGGKPPSISYISYVKKALESIPRTLRLVSSPVIPKRRLLTPESVFNYVVICFRVVSNIESLVEVMKEYFKLAREGRLHHLREGNLVSATLHEIYEVYGYGSIDEVIREYLITSLKEVELDLSELSRITTYTAYLRSPRLDLKFRARVYIDEKLYNEIIEVMKKLAHIREELSVATSTRELYSLINTLVGINCEGICESSLLNKVVKIVEKILKTRYFEMPLPNIFLATYVICDVLVVSLAKEVKEAIKDEGLNVENITELRRRVKKAIKNALRNLDNDLVGRLGTLIPKESITKLIESVEVIPKVVVTRGRVPVLTLRIEIKHKTAKDVGSHD